MSAIGSSAITNAASASARERRRKMPKAKLKDNEREYLKKQLVEFRKKGGEEAVVEEDEDVGKLTTTVGFPLAAAHSSPVFIVCSPRKTKYS